MLVLLLLDLLACFTESAFAGLEIKDDFPEVS